MIQPSWTNYLIIDSSLDYVKCICFHGAKNNMLSTCQKHKVNTLATVTAFREDKSGLLTYCSNKHMLVCAWDNIGIAVKPVFGSSEFIFLLVNKPFWDFPCFPCFNRGSYWKHSPVHVSGDCELYGQRYVWLHFIF